jgi:hypothetical protein
MAVELDGCGCGHKGLSGCGCKFAGLAAPIKTYTGGADVDGGSSYFPGAPLYVPASSLSEGISYGRGTGPGYTHGVLSKPRFAPTLPPTRFTPNERVLVAESQDMFYGLDDLESTGKGLFWLVAAGGLAWWLLGRRI